MRRECNAEHAELIEHFGVGGSDGDWACHGGPDVSGRATWSSVSSGAGVCDSSGSARPRRRRRVHAHRHHRSLSPPRPPGCVHDHCGHTERVASMPTGRRDGEATADDPRRHLLRHWHPLIRVSRHAE
jgi:hypothetical protein